MSPSAAENVHPDFAHSTGLTLVSSDGVTFHIDSAALSRSSGFFRGMFTLPQGANQHQSITVDEDAFVMAILLKLASGLPTTELDQLSSYDDIERVIVAADKYDMPGAAQVLLLVMRKFLATPDAARDPFLHYATACVHGLVDLADQFAETLATAALDWERIPPMSSDQLARIVRARHARITAFHSQLRSKADGPFTVENTGICMCPYRHELGQQLAMWKSFVAEACVQFTQTPSIEAVLSHPTVQGVIEEMEYVMCPTCVHERYGPQGQRYIWKDIRKRFRLLCTSPSHVH